MTTLFFIFIIIENWLNILMNYREDLIHLSWIIAGNSFRKSRPGLSQHYETRMSLHKTISDRFQVFHFLCWIDSRNGRLRTVISRRWAPMEASTCQRVISLWTRRPTASIPGRKESLRTVIGWGDPPPMPPTLPKVTVINHVRCDD